MLSVNMMEPRKSLPSLSVLNEKLSASAQQMLSIQVINVVVSEPLNLSSLRCVVLVADGQGVYL